jgi:hypothetical protein
LQELTDILIDIEDTWLDIDKFTDSSIKENMLVARKKLETMEGKYTSGVWFPRLKFIGNKATEVCDLTLKAKGYI